MKNQATLHYSASDLNHSLSDKTENLLDQQLTHWDLAKQNYAALKTVESKTVDVLGFPIQVQFNPSRIVSSAAKVDPESIQQRPCFLCGKNRPAEQEDILVDDRYWVLVNPFPIFPKHLTIPFVEHIDQRIAGHFEDMLDLAQLLPEYVLFYNGPQCGASAPDHLHFQAGSKGFLPLEMHWNEWRCFAERIVEHSNFSLLRHITYPHALLVMESSDRQTLITWFENIYRQLESPDNGVEPMMNLLCSWENGEWIVWLFPRRLHRPVCYFADGEQQLLISPASVDLAGVFITPREEDFQKVTASDLATIMDEVSISCDLLDRICHLLRNL
jgi:ATP adenylyltransferase/5',5'''-P-1,P-4-tetraphosphate phosphorylase II